MVSYEHDLYKPGVHIIKKNILYSTLTLKKMSENNKYIRTIIRLYTYRGCVYTSTSISNLETSNIILRAVVVLCI